MFRYTTWYINIVSLIISVIVFCFTNFFISSERFINFNNNFNSETKLDLQSELQIPKQLEILNSKESSIISNDEINTSIQPEEKDWYIEIPKINLKAYIEEGTSKEIMNDYIGHFEETSRFNGNIGLAAHNRGYKNNYFENLKSLREEDKIYYCYEGKIKEYAVINNFIIEDTDWTVFEEKEDNNIITLITCVENEPSYRRCVQAKEIIK